MQELNPQWHAAQSARCADRDTLAQLLRTTRARTLALAQAYRDALGPTLRVPYSTQVNPPMWELGHIAWFQDRWIARNTQRALGTRCDHTLPLAPSRLAQADTLYDSSQVAHASRWQLNLPDWHHTNAYLQAVLDDTLRLLATAPHDDDSLYFYRLVLFHEDMHAEAAVYMAQALGVQLGDGLAWPARPSPALAPAPRGHSEGTGLHLNATCWALGYTDSGFAFDNELGTQPVDLADFEIDRTPVSWRQYLEFVEDCSDQDASLPRYLRRRDGGAHWQCPRFGVWQALDLDSPATHLRYDQAQAWCRWAGRGLPSEAQWEYAAMTQPTFVWGRVWEWTASPFAPYPGFAPHPYRDYSMPWFDGRPVLRGASAATAAHMVHPRYRNYFTPERNDIFAGFRSCALRA
jgi:iron(II)-dependent oxidoreductase